MSCGAASMPHRSLRRDRERGLLEDYQFQQQMRVVEAELQLWDPAAADGMLGDLRSRPGFAASRESRRAKTSPLSRPAALARRPGRR